MATETGGTRRSTLVIGVAGVASALLIASLLIVLSLGNTDAIGGLVVGPILFLLSVPILRRRATLDGDRRLFWLLILALLLKFVGTLARYYVAFDVYGGVADASTYHDWGVRISSGFSVGDFDTGLETLSGTDFLKFFTGIVYAVTGTTQLGGFLVFSWLGFWGLYFFYRAYSVAVPEGRARHYAYLLFFLPSLLYWPSSTGKEAWMMFSLGIGALGVARILTGRMGRGLVVAAIGMWLASLVRPHVAGLVGLALVMAYLVRPAPKDRRAVAGLSKAAALVVLGVVAVVMLVRTDQFLQSQGIGFEGGIEAALENTAERTAIGGSQFEPSVLQSPLRAPVAVVTVLYRPLVFEAHNLQSLVAAAEGTFLFIFTLIRFRWIIASFRTLRRQSYVAFVIVYVGLFIVAFSSIANFGILARERVQMLPLALVLVTIPPGRQRRSGRSRRPEESAETEDRV
jgi:hypothetical protein